MERRKKGGREPNQHTKTHSRTNVVIYDLCELILCFTANAVDAAAFAASASAHFSIGSGEVLVRMRKRILLISPLRFFLGFMNFMLWSFCSV